MYYIEKLSEIF